MLPWAADPAWILTIITATVIASEWLVRRTFLRHFGTALLVILLGAVVANAGVIPAGGRGPADGLYGGIFGWVAPLSIFWLLLRVDLRSIVRAGGAMIGLFLVGSVGTVLGVVAGMAAIGGAGALGEHYAAVGGMYAGTYTGGSVNFNAVALEYGVVQKGGLYVGAVAVDNIVTAVWMITCIAVPRALRGRWPASRAGTVTGPAAESPETADRDPDEETVTPGSLAAVVATGCAALWIGNVVAELASGVGWRIPPMLTITVVALIVAQTPLAGRLQGAQALGMGAVYVFLTVIGVYCDVGALMALGDLAPKLSLLAAVIVLVHGSLTFGMARVARLDLDTAAVASQANIGGGTSALALARSLGRSDLVLPAIVMGALGNALGNFLGFLVAGQLL